MTTILLLCAIIGLVCVAALVCTVIALDKAIDTNYAYHAAVQYARDKGLMLPTVIEAVDLQFFPQSAGEKEK